MTEPIPTYQEIVPLEDRWAYLEEEIEEHFWYEFEQITRVFQDNIFDGLVFHRPPRFTEEP